MTTIKTTFNSLVCFLITMFLLLAVLPVTASAGEPQEKVVRVGVLDDVYIRVNSNGDRSGYGYEYQRAISAITGWTYEYVDVDWSNCFDMLQSGEIDILGGVSSKEERRGKMLFSDMPMGEERYYLYKKSTNDSISADNPRTLNGMNIGVLKDSIPERLLSDWENSLNISSNHVNIVSAEETLNMLKNHEIDCFMSLDDPLWVSEELSAFAHIGSSDVFFVINNNRADLKSELDSAMRQIDLDKPYYAETLYQKYFSSISSPSLSADEKAWLDSHGSIRIGYWNNDPGISVVNPENGTLVGALNDYIQIAENCFISHKISFEPVGFDTQTELHQALTDGKIDMIFHVNHNSSKAEEKQFALSYYTCKLNVAAITGQNAFDENAENTVAISRDNILSKWYVSCNYPQWKILEYDTTKEAENAVRNGMADCLVIRAERSAKSLEDSKIRSVLLSRMDYASFAVRKQDTVLLSVMNKTLKTLPSAKLSGVVAMYDNTLQRVTLEDFLKDNLNIVIAVFVLVFGVIFAVIISLLRKTKNALKQAEKANAAKTNFLFNMSHDIRTPMNALMGYNELMKKELTDPRLLDYQEKMEQSGNLLLTIINNVLDMARIESGKIELDENYLNTEQLIGEIIDVFEESANEKKITLVHEVNITHKHIICDEVKIKQILVNLLSNAIKYTPDGGTVSIVWTELTADKEGFVKLKAEITDNGIGMSKEFLSHVFENFARERNTTISKVAGTGLGLPIVKKLTELMGGTIGIESEQGKGTRFTVILQHRIADKVYYERKEAEAKSAAPSDSSREMLVGRHILMAEDNELNAEIAITILEEMGLVVDRVEDGIECVDRITKQPAGTYELILMDIQMPNMDGYKATQAIRRLEDKDKANIPIIAMTANAFEEDRKKALENGMNGHLAKPIEVDKVTKTLLSILNGSFENQRK